MVWLQKSDWEKTRADFKDGDYYQPESTSKKKKENIRSGLNGIRGKMKIIFLILILTITLSASA